LPYADVDGGNSELARQALARLESLEDPSAGCAIYSRLAYAAVGDLDRGMQYLELAMDDADPHAMYVEVFHLVRRCGPIPDIHEFCNGNGCRGSERRPCRIPVNGAKVRSPVFQERGFPPNDSQFMHARHQGSPR
jgi:hypothetical protein